MLTVAKQIPLQGRDKWDTIKKRAGIILVNA